MSVRWFANIVVHHPWIVLVGIAVLSGTCLIIPVSMRNFPSFQDPQMGFETRGTELAGRLIAWRNLVESTKPSGIFAVNPKETIEMQNNKNKYLKSRKKKNNIPIVKSDGNTTTVTKNGRLIHIGTEEKFAKINKTEKRRNETKWSLLEKLVKHNFTTIKESRRKHHKPISNAFFCESPDGGYAQIVIKSEQGDLFNLDSLFVLCRLQIELAKIDHYTDLCVYQPATSQCCRAWSLPNYIALLHGRTSCLGITEEDVNSTKALLSSCSKFYHNLKLGSDCDESHCAVPPKCTKNNAVYNILNYLTSTAFAPPNASDQLLLPETILMLPIACSVAAMPFYHAMLDGDSSSSPVPMRYSEPDLTVVAMQFGLKTILFDECLRQDGWLLTAGAALVVIALWHYTRSLFLTLMTIIAIVFALAVAYFLYMYVFELAFFPFMNLLAVVVAFGIGADDAFVFYKIWTTVKAEIEDKNSVEVMRSTLYHSLTSMFVTSLTTSVAFFASCLSSITAIRCFSIFAGTAVLCNYCLMAGWIPACFALSDRHQGCEYRRFGRRLASAVFLLHGCQVRAGTLIRTVRAGLVDGLVGRAAAILALTMLTSVAIAAGVVVFHWPRLQLPTSTDFQLFAADHPFEKYDMVYRDKFWFSRQDSQNSAYHYNLPLRFVWGILPKDNGDPLNPRSTGTLHTDSDFDISTPAAQSFLLHFCRQLRQQPFYQSRRGPLLPNCFIETFIAWMERRRCHDTFGKPNSADRGPCCETTKFPYPREVFTKCLVESLADLYNTPSEYLIPGMAGPKFTKDKITVAALVVEYESNYTYSMSYEYMWDFINQVETWMHTQLEKAPPEMQRGWFVSELDFYDVQRVLIRDTVVQICVSMGFALIILLIATCNVLSSLYAVFTITCSIVVTLAVLVLFGWQLNILESVAVTAAIGLTVDFSLHYTIQYHHSYSPEQRGVRIDRITATKTALSTMLGPATMAALTTALVGTVMLPSTVLAYRQIGLFLVTVMVVSWVYATFHLGAMLALGGSEKEPPVKSRNGERERQEEEQQKQRFGYSSLLCWRWWRWRWWWWRRKRQRGNDAQPRRRRRDGGNEEGGDCRRRATGTTATPAESLSNMLELVTLTSGDGTHDDDIQMISTASGSVECGGISTLHDVNVHEIPLVRTLISGESSTNIAAAFQEQSPSTVSVMTVITGEDN